MSKAEDEYVEYFLDGRLRNCSSKEAFLLGYHQAKKDLALTWEDINRIEIIIKDVYRNYPRGIKVKQFGTELLSRFNKQKGK